MILTMATAASAETNGWGLGVGAFDGDFSFQARKTFVLGGDISQITAQAGLYFPGKTSFRLNGDYHFMIGSGSSRFYPLAGINFTFNSDSAKFGINGGGGVNFKLTEKMAGFFEAKYVFGDWDGWSFLGGIYF